VIEARVQGRVGEFAMDAELAVPAEGVTGLIGPSASGKTTLLRCIAGLVRLKGRVVVKGEVWQDARSFVPPHRRAVGFVFQDTALLPHLSVRGNLLYGYRRSRSDRRFAFEEVVALLALEPLLKRSTARLSGGERQRVAIGRALLSQPQLLLMDEPLSSLDQASKAEILPFLERIHRSLQIPVIYVSHDASEIARLADRVLVMDAGRIVASGPQAGDAMTASAARQALGGMDGERVAGLALAALMAGLKPIA
jgi:molybdate transport system ATP-binding protein